MPQSSPQPASLGLSSTLRARWGVLTYPSDGDEYECIQECQHAM